MEPTQIAALVGIAKDLKDVWDKTHASDQMKMDAVVRSMANVLLQAPELSSQRQFIVEGTDVLPMRLAGLFLDPKIRELAGSALSRFRNGSSEPKRGEFLVVKCRQCGSVQDLPPILTQKTIKEI